MSTPAPGIERRRFLSCRYHYTAVAFAACHDIRNSGRCSSSVCRPSHKTPRMRVWRALKSRGAKPLRDGVYVLPESAAAREALEEQARDVIDSGGSAQVLNFSSGSEGQQHELVSMFDRSDAYAEVLDSLDRLKRRVAKLDEGKARRELLAVRREFDALAAIDFFPGARGARSKRRSRTLQQHSTRRFSPDEPHAASGRIAARDPRRYRGRTWAYARTSLDRSRRVGLADPALHRSEGEVSMVQETEGLSRSGRRFRFRRRGIHARRRACDVRGADGRVSDWLTTTHWRESGMIVHYLDVGGVAVAGSRRASPRYAAGLRAEQATDDALPRRDDIGARRRCIRAFTETSGKTAMNDT